MSNFELIDDYLANRLNEQERSGFEQQLAGDPALKEEVQFQQRVIEGVRQARAAELKNMLKDVPLNGSTWSTGKFTAAAVTVGIVATSLYFYMKDDQQPAQVVENPKQENIQESNKPQETVIIPTDSTDASSGKTTQAAREKTGIESSNKAAKPVTKPNIQVTDPSVEFTETEHVTDRTTASRSEITPSKMEVITGVPDKKHNFHYQFADSKLLLYGPFDKSLYEILEIHGDGHAVFLFYKENYYLLDEKQSAITSLEPIRDAQLLKKLKEYRGR